MKDPRDHVQITGTATEAAEVKITGVGFSGNRQERRAKERAERKKRKKIFNAPELAVARDQIIKLLTAFFEKEPEKVHKWMAAPNPGLGYISPARMIQAGRHVKLLQFVKTQLEEGGFDVEAVLSQKETE